MDDEVGLSYEPDVSLPVSGEQQEGDFEDNDEIFDFGIDLDQGTLTPGANQTDLEFLREAFPKALYAQWTQIVSPERQPVIIEARALFGMAIDNILIDWSHGGESLHVIYSFEYILQRLSDKGWDVVVAFFDVLPYNQAESTDRLLLAEILCNHLKHLATKRSDILQVEYFEDWWSDKWNEFIGSHHPSLIVIDLPQTCDTDASVPLNLTDGLKVMLFDLFSQGIRTVSSDFRIDTSSIWSFELSPRANFVSTFIVPMHEQLRTLAQSSPSEVFSESEYSKIIETLGQKTDLASEVITVALGKIIKDANMDEKTISLAKCYILAHILGRSIPLRLRTQPFNFTLQEEDQVLLRDFFQKLNSELYRALINAKKSRNDLTDLDIAYIDDLVDGRFFTIIFTRICSLPNKTLESANIGWSSQAENQASLIWKALLEILSKQYSFLPIIGCSQGDIAEIDVQNEDNNLAGSAFVDLTSNFTTSIEPVGEIDSLSNKLGLIGSEDNPFMFGTPDSTVYQNQKSFQLETPKSQTEKPTSRKEQKYQTKQRQKYYTYLEKFAASLNTTSRSNHIVLARSDSLPLTQANHGEESESDKNKKKKQVQAKGGRGGKGKKGHINHKERILNKTKGQKASEDLNTVKSAIDFANEEPVVLDKMRRLSNKLRDMRAKSNPAPSAMILGYMKLIEWAMNHWERQCVTFDDEEDLDDFEVIDHSSGARDYSGAVYVVRFCYDTFDFYLDDLAPADIRTIQGHLLTLGFPDAAEQIHDQYVSRMQQINPKNVKNAKISRRRASALQEACSVGISFQTFQLAHCGHLMQRSFDSQKDTRVSGFLPDKWQRELLDIVDTEQSALVVAPTSSGKTFISYYTMKKVLERNRLEKYLTAPRLVVYIAPTKALIRQVEAEVYKHYGPVVGVLAEDYHQNLEGCQVVITVPSVLEELLFIPEWANRVDYCILDEIHCIEDFGTGDESTNENNRIVWEHVIELLTCPFIALSATIGNPQSFCSWLQTTQERYNRKVHLVEHSYRWSDLKLLVYLPTEPNSAPAFSGTLKQMTDTPCLSHLHPIAVLSLFCIQNGKLNSVRVAPEECLILYNTMVQLAEEMSLEEICNTLDTFHPDKYFKGIIKRLEVYKYESDLKDLLSKWSHSKEYIPLVEAIISKLAGNLHGPKASYPSSSRYTSDYFLPMLVEMYNSNRLPALVFCLDRNRCNKLGLDLIKLLEENETIEKLKPSYVRKLREIIKKEIKAEKNTKRGRDEDEKVVKTLQDSEAQDEEQVVIPHKDEPLPKFSFIPKSEGVHIEDREYWIERISKKKNATYVDMLIRGLERGIAIHHSALPQSYRIAVEALFRAGHLQVVITTGTLSLGINMPCKTVVFAGDYPTLTPLTFQQMSGRAGRRGFDDFGNIVFFSLPKHRVFTLVSSSVAKLNGSQPITPSVTLRALVSFNTIFKTNIKNKEDKEKSVKRLGGLLNPALFSWQKSPEARDEYNGYCRFLFRIYMDYLHRLALISKSSVPADIAELALNLFKSEPSNFIICYFLLSGEFGNICSASDTKFNKSYKLLLLLSYFVKPVPVTNLMASLVTSKAIPTTSSVLLPPLEENLRNQLESLNRQTLNLFVKSLRKYYTDRIRNTSSTCELPFSNIRIGSNLEASQDQTLISQLQANAIEVILRSPFVSLSGHYDNFSSVQELVTSCNLLIPIEADDIPSSIIQDVRGREMALSSYATDFFLHARKKLLVTENGLKEGVAWELIHNLETIVKQLWKYKGLPDSIKETINFLCDDPQQGLIKKFKAFNVRN